jgi:hypothetical protein
MKTEKIGGDLRQTTQLDQRLWSGINTAADASRYRPAGTSWAHATIRPKFATHPETVFNSMALGRLSPYLTSHVNRFGVFHLELDRQPPAIDYNLPILSV